MIRPDKRNDWPVDILSVYNHDLQEIWDPSIAPHIFNSYNDEIRSYIQLAKQYAPRLILDVGCAQGTLALMLGESGYNVYAIDIRESFLNYARLRYEYGNVRFVLGDILVTEFEEKFDLIFVNQVLEHLVDPLPLLKRLRSLLTPRGHLVVTTPNHNYLKNKLPSHRGIGNHDEYFRFQCSADGEDHFFAFTADELNDYFKLSGFSEVKIEYYATPWITGHCKIRHLHRFVPPWLLRSLNIISLNFPFFRSYFCYQLLVIAEA